MEVSAAVVAEAAVVEASVDLGALELAWDDEAMVVVFGYPREVAAEVELTAEATAATPLKPLRDAEAADATEAAEATDAA